MEKWGISRYRYEELRAFCMQYREWKRELASIPEISGQGFDAVAKGKTPSSPTEAIALRRTDLEQRCRIVETAAEEAGPGISEYLLRAVTEEFCGSQYLRERCGMPCGRNYFYNSRRRFFALLNSRKK